MSYTSRHRHKTRRERYLHINRNLRKVIFFAMLAIIVLLIKNRVQIYDTVRMWFY